MKQVNIVKIGSESVTKANIALLGNQIKDYQEQTGEGFIIISSGAKALGEDEVARKGLDANLFSKAGLCAIGQSLLMNLYSELFSQDLVLAQRLVDDWQNETFILELLQKFKNHKNISLLLQKLLKYLNSKKDRHLVQTLDDLVKNNVIAIINHNDALSSLELSRVSSKADNDVNVAYICSAINKNTKYNSFKIKKVVYLTNTNGLLDETLNTISGGEVSKNDREYYLSFVRQDKSSKGTGGMGSKVNGCFYCLEYGAESAIIANSSNGIKSLSGEGNFSEFRY